MLPKDILHELQQGGDIGEDIKEFFRLKERRAHYPPSNLRSGIPQMGSYASTMAMGSFVPGEREGYFVLP